MTHPLIDDPPHGVVPDTPVDQCPTHGGYVGVLLMGAALVITSFTCTVPFVATLLAAASQGGLSQIIVGMGVFG